MNVRRASAGDKAVLEELWSEFERETPEPEGFAPETWEQAWSDLETDMEQAGVYLAEEDGSALGMLDASAATPTRWHVETVHVRPTARRRGVATELLRACAGDARAQGVSHVSLEVLASNEIARTVWRRLGFAEVEHVLAQPLDALEARLGLASAAAATSHGAVHAQTDDRDSVEHALAQIHPPLAAPSMAATPGGWLRVADARLDADFELRGELAQELSDRLGTVALALGVEQGAVVRYRLYEHGRMVDEYLSVPGFYGELSTGDALAFEANATMVARLTAASFDQVRQVARTAASPAELPPAEELYAQIATMMGVEA